MKKILTISLFVVAAVASQAQAFDVGGPLESRTLDLGSGAAIQDVPTVVYSGVPGPYSAFASATGVCGFDDYHASVSTSVFKLDSLKFVGGTAAVNGRIDFQFFDSSANYVGGFFSNLPSAGDFIWTINGLSGLNLNIPKDGILQIVAGAGSGTGSGVAGRWFLTTTAPTIGTNSVTYGTGSGLNPQRNNAFELTAVPEPTSMVALTAGVAALLRRRKK